MHLIYKVQLIFPFKIYKTELCLKLYLSNHIFQNLFDILICLVHLL